MSFARAILCGLLVEGLPIQKIESAPIIPILSTVIGEYIAYMSYLAIHLYNVRESQSHNIGRGFIARPYAFANPFFDEKDFCHPSISIAALITGTLLSIAGYACIINNKQGLAYKALSCIPGIASFIFLHKVNQHACILWLG